MKRIMIKLFNKIREDILRAQDCQEYYIQLHLYFKGTQPERCSILDYMQFDYLPKWFRNYFRR
jgi:hypothetical protein